MSAETAVNGLQSEFVGVKPEETVEEVDYNYSLLKIIVEDIEQSAQKPQNLTSRQVENVLDHVLSACAFELNNRGDVRLSCGAVLLVEEAGYLISSRSQAMADKFTFLGCVLSSAPAGAIYHVLADKGIQLGMQADNGEIFTLLADRYSIARLAKARGFRPSPELTLEETRNIADWLLDTHAAL